MKRFVYSVLASFLLIMSAPAMANASSADDLINIGKKYMGTKYVWGGTTPRGFDCSGYTQYVFREAGVSIPRTTWTQYTTGKAVSKSQLKTGDLVFFNTAGGPSHVGIYIQGGKFIHASTSQGVTITPLNDPYYWGKRYLGARRVKDFAPKKPVIEYASRAQVAEILADDLNLNVTTTSGEQAPSFPDVPTNHPQHKAITAVAAAGIFSGASDGTFNPNQNLTRGQLAKVLVEAYGLQGKSDLYFNDVPTTNWAHRYVNTLAANNVTLGYGNGKFGVNDNIKLKDFKTFVERAKAAATNVQ